MKMTRTKIMLFSHICKPTHITGAEKYLLLMLKELQTRYNCILVVPNEGMLSELARTEGITVEVQPYELLWSAYKPNVALLKQLDRSIQSTATAPLVDLLQLHCPDLVLTNTCTNVSPAIAAKKAGIPVAWIIHEVIDSTPYTPYVIDFITRHADFLIGCSQTALQPFNGSSSGEKFVLFPSFDWDCPSKLQDTYRSRKRSELGIADSDILVGFISSDLVPHKGLRDFIQMSLQLCSHFQHVHFTIVGNPTEPDYLNENMACIQSSEYSSRFSLIPFEKKIETLYPGIDILVVPSLISEGFGMTALEGMAYGKPIVAYSSGGLSEIMNATGNRAFLAESGDISAISQLVSTLIMNEELRNLIGDHNHKASTDMFGIEAYRQRLNEFLEAVRYRVSEIDKKRRRSYYSFPNGIILKGSSSNTVFLLEQGVKRPFVNPEALYFYQYGWEDVILVQDSELQNYPSGNPIQGGGFYDLSPSIFLAKGSSSTVYLIKNKVRNPFESETVFRRLRYEFHKVLVLPDILLETLPIGHTISDHVLELHGMLPQKLYRSPQGDIYYGDDSGLTKMMSYVELLFYRWKQGDIINLTDAEFRRVLK